MIIFYDKNFVGPSQTGCSDRTARRCAELRTAWRISLIGALRLRTGTEGSRERWQDGKH